MVIPVVVPVVSVVVVARAAHVRKAKALRKLPACIYVCVCALRGSATFSGANVGAAPTGKAPQGCRAATVCCLPGTNWLHGENGRFEGM